MMHQGVLPIQCKIERTGSEVTGRAGLVPYLDLMAGMGLWRLSDRLVGARRGEQGWTDGQHVAACVLLNLAGGDCVDDIERLEGDSGLGVLVREAEVHGLPRRERRRLSRRHRKGRERSFPSPSALRRYLERFDDPGQEKARAQALEAGVKAFIPAQNEHLRGLAALNAAVVSRVQSLASEKQATIDMDATLVESWKQEALYGYKHFRCYQPLNVWWAEQELVVRSEFRDGNVPAGYQQLRVFEETLADLPAGVERVLLRSDSAGYQWDLLRYCAEGKSERFGVIEFAVGSDVDESFKRSVAETPEDAWRPLRREVGDASIETGQEWAEVCFVPAEAARKKDGPEYRFIAVREPLRQLELPGMEARQLELPFPTMRYGDGREYKLHAMVTNRRLPGDEVIWWYRERCGKSEEAHAVMKHDLAGGTLPSKLFGANAAWWQLMVVAHNVHSAMKRLVLGPAWSRRRLKAVRFGFINVVGRVLRHARGMILKLCGSMDTCRSVIEARVRVRELVEVPDG